MAKVPHIYSYETKKGKRWKYVASLGYDSITGKRIRREKGSFLTQEMASNAYLEFVSQNKRNPLTSKENLTYEEYFENYFLPRRKQEMSEHTFQTKMRYYNNYFPYWNKIKLSKIDGTLVQNWKTWLVDVRHLASATRRQVFNEFKISLEFAITLGLINQNWAVRIGNFRQQKQKVKFWTLEDFQKALSLLDKGSFRDHLHYITLWLLFMTGMRIGEVAALTWEDVDFDQNIIKVTKSMWYESEREWKILPPKTEAGNRLIALDNQTMDELRDWKLHQEQNFVIGGFVVTDNTMPLVRSSFLQWLNRISKKAGLPKITVHQLRHSHASLLVALGINPLEVKERLGHSRIETTLGTYSHLYKEANREVANKLSDFIKKK